MDPALERTRETDAVIRAENAGLFVGIYASQAIEAELIGGETAPIAGWTSCGYGSRQPSAVLRATLAGSAGNSGPGTASLAAMTFLVPRSAAAGVERLTVDAGNAIACAYRHGLFTDIAVFSTGTSEVQVAGLRMQGEFFWLRMEGQVIRRSLAIRVQLQPVSAFLLEAVCAPFTAS